MSELDNGDAEKESIEVAPLLTTPRNDGRGLTPLVNSDSAFEAMISELLNGHGPIAIDAERASGYTYSQRAYLIQIYRRNGGLHLIDPISIGDKSLWRKLSDEFRTEEWIVHASTQDLPCLREVGLDPRFLFDTELGGRIAGAERVGLGPLTENLLGIRLAKEHSAVDWSTRPLPEPWLNYAALDVDVLVDLRDAVREELISQNKLSWAEEEFASILSAPPSPARIDPWRKTSGIHKIRDRRTLGIIRDMWIARDTYARSIDKAAGRIFNDEVLMEIASRRPSNIDTFTKLITRRKPGAKYPFAEWFQILRDSLALPEDQLPPARLPSQTLPPVKVWQEKNPRAYARYTHARAVLNKLSTERSIPVENLVSPEYVRQSLWVEPPAESSQWSEFVEESLRRCGARSWQIGLVAPILSPILGEREPLVVAAPEADSDPEMPEKPEA